MTLWNSAYPLSTLSLIVAGSIIDHLTYFQYLLCSAMWSIGIAVICILTLPSFTVYALSRGNRARIDVNMQQSQWQNVFALCSRNSIFIAMMTVAALDSMLVAMMNLMVGPYLADHYHLDPQQLGIYVTISIGSAELFTSAVIVPFVSTPSRFLWMIASGAAMELMGIIAWNIMQSTSATVLQIEWTLMVIGIVFLGHEAIFCGILFKNQYVAHKSQQMILNSLWGVVMAVSRSLGILMVGEFYEMGHGVDLLLMVLNALSIGVICSAGGLCYIQWRGQAKSSAIQAV